MNPFVHLPNYYVIVCIGLECKYAIQLTPSIVISVIVISLL